MTALKKTGEPKASGGAGRGQGRKPADGVADKEQKCVLMSAQNQATARQLGGGNLSLGVAIALQHARDSGLAK